MMAIDVYFKVQQSPTFNTIHSLHKDVILNKTNQELWEEAIRTAELLDTLVPSLEPIMSAMFRRVPAVDMDKLPIDYVSDAQILTNILLNLKARGAKVA
ncbi:MAG: hypothetical protein IPO57_10250 [Rhodocyclales bacterium]|nr:hypothetical protein [Rhodocyclales bacterium]